MNEGDSDLTVAQRERRMLEIFMAWIFGPAMIAFHFWLYCTQGPVRQMRFIYGVITCMMFAVMLGWTCWVIYQCALFLERHGFQAG